MTRELMHVMGPPLDKVALSRSCVDAYGAPRGRLKVVKVELHGASFSPEVIVLFWAAMHKSVLSSCILTIAVSGSAGLFLDMLERSSKARMIVHTWMLRQR